MNGRTKFVVVWLVLLYVVSWTFSLSRLFGMHFWDVNYVRETYFPITEEDGDTVELTPDASMYNSTAMEEIGYSYYVPDRYFYFLPHVLGAVFWWNFYFLQLIPKVRHSFNKKLHRILGRCLMLAALLQTVTGCGLALTTEDSHVIPLVSFALAIGVLYCLVYAYKYARQRDIPKHKYWVLRMVGYLQTISLQRFWFFVLLMTHQLGWYGMYPNLNVNQQVEGVNEQANQVVRQMFDDSFLMSILTSFLVTEWYLAGEQGMVGAAVPLAANIPLSDGDAQQHGQESKTLLAEGQPLFGQQQRLSMYSS